MYGVLDAGLLLFHLALGRGPDVDLGDSARDLGQALLELLAVVVRGRRIDLGADLLDATGNLGRVTRSLDDGGVILVYDHALRPAEVFERDTVELDAEVLVHRPAAGQGGDVAEHRLAAVAVARRLDCRALKHAAQLVDHERGQGVGLDRLGDDDERFPGLADLFHHRDEVLGRRDLVLVYEDERVAKVDLHRLRVADEVGREVTAVKLHSLDDLNGRLSRLAFLDGHHAVFADFFESVRYLLADLGVVVRGDGRDLGDIGLALDGLRDLGERRDDLFDRLLHSADEVRGVGAGHHVLEAFEVQRLGQHRRSRGAVAGDVTRLRGRLLHHLDGHVLVLVSELDFLRHGDTVLGHGRTAPTLLEHCVAAAGAEGALDRAGELNDAFSQRLPSFHLEHHLFCHLADVLLFELSQSTVCTPGRTTLYVQGTLYTNAVPADAGMCRIAAEKPEPLPRQAVVDAPWSRRWAQARKFMSHWQANGGNPMP